MNRSSRITRGPNVGCGQGGRGTVGERSRAVSHAICYDLLRDYWPLIGLFAVVILGGKFA